MNLTIVLPKYLNYPIGGYKVQFEYANRLQKRGHDVTLVFPRTTEPRGGLWGPLKSRIWPLAVQMRKRPVISWFPLDPQVRVLLVPNLHPKYLPPADVLIATAWQTAEALRTAPPRHGSHYYIVYDYEFWASGDLDTRTRIAATFHAGFKMIATSPSVQMMLAESDAQAQAYIPCGIDLAQFGVDVPLTSRDALHIGFPVRSEIQKGTADAVAALAQLRDRRGTAGLRVSAFGPEPAPDLPDWVTYHHRPTDAALRAFYNSLSVFLFPSHSEGWGLTGMEALACGTALAASDSVGLRDYAIDGETALVVPIRRPDLLADAAQRLLADDALRSRLATHGTTRVQSFTWTRAVDALEAQLRAI